MTLHYILIAVVFFACSCEDRQVTGIVVQSKLSVQPRILPVATPVEKTDAESEVEKNLSAS
jgi:hypothetical protein